MGASKKIWAKTPRGGCRWVLLAHTENLLHHPNRWRSGHGEPLPHLGSVVGCYHCLRAYHSCTPANQMVFAVLCATTTRCLSGTVKKITHVVAWRVMCHHPLPVSSPPTNHVLPSRHHTIPRLETGPCLRWLGATCKARPENGYLTSCPCTRMTTRS